MDSDAVYRQIRNLIQHWGTNDPLQLAADMGIMLYACPDFIDKGYTGKSDE